MTRCQRLLAALILLELAVAGFLVVRRSNEPAPPLPDLSGADAVTARDLRALAADCHDTEGWAKLAEALLAAGYFSEAERGFAHAVRLEPDNADVIFKHAFALERLGRIDEANQRFHAAAARKHPRSNECWYYIGKNHLRQEQEVQAQTAFVQAGNLPAARYELALLALRSGRLDDAETEAAKLANEHTDSYPPISLRYRLALARGDARAANALADLFTRKPRPLPTPYDKEVDWVFTAANHVGPNRVFNEAGRQMQAGRLAETEKGLRQALAAQWDPKIADKLAETVFQLGRPLEAVDILSDAMARDRPSWELLWRMGQAYEATGQSGAALAAWERAARVATGPRAAGLWEDLAQRYRRVGDKVQAKSAEGQANIATGWDALDAGRPGQSVQAFERATSLAPTSAQAWFGLGEAARLAGQAKQAGAAYDACLKISSDHGGARRGRDFFE